MATDRIVAIYPTGATDPISDTPNNGGSYSATYTTMNAMETAEDGDLTDAGGTRLLVEIIESDGSWSGAPEDNRCTFDGWLTDRTSGEYISVETFGGARSSTGLWDTTAYIFQDDTNNQPAFQIDNDTTANEYIDIELIGIQFRKYTNGNYVCRINANGYHHDVRFEKCYFKQDAAAVNFLMAYNNNTDFVFRVKNCILDGGSEIIKHPGEPNAAYWYNDTIFGASVADAFESDGSANVYPVNCAVFNNVDDFQDAFPAGYPNYCASDDVDGTNPVNISPGATELDDWHNAFTDPDGSPPDVTIKDASSVLHHDINTYQSQTGSTEVPSDDIIGTARPDGDEDCGAFQYAVAGTTVQIGKQDLTLSAQSTSIIRSKTFALNNQSLLLTINSVTVSTAISNTVAISSQALTLSTNAVTVATDHVQAVGKQDLALNANAVSLQRGASIAIGKQDLTLTPQSVSLQRDATISISKVDLSLTINPVTVSTADVNIVQINSQALTLTPQAISLISDATLAINKQDLTLNANAVSLQRGASIAINKQNLTLTANTVTVSTAGENIVSIGSQALTLTPKSVSLARDFTAVLNKQDLTLTPQGVSIVHDFTAALNKQDLSLSINAVTVSALSGAVIAIGKQDLMLAPNAVSILSDGAIAITSQALTLSPKSITILSGGAVALSKQDLTLTPYAVVAQVSYAEGQVKTNVRARAPTLLAAGKVMSIAATIKQAEITAIAA